MTDIRMSQMAGVPFGSSADRPTSPEIGQTFYNGTLGVQEIYTASGWLPATGANDFNVALSGGFTSVTFTKDYFAGAYTITSSLSDATYDIYLFNGSGSQVGYTKTPSMVASDNFNKMVVLGGTNGDLLSFTYKTTFTATSTNSEVTSGPFILSISPAALPNADDSTTVTGGNFASNITAKFVGTDSVDRSAKSVIRSSSSQIIVTRPDSLPVQYEPYSLVVDNPGVTSPTGSNSHILQSSTDAGSIPLWQTSASLPVHSSGLAYSTTILATDTEGSTMQYSLQSGSLPSWASLSSSTGIISGTPNESSEQSYTFTIRATDAGGNYSDRTFTMNSNVAPSWTTASGTVISTESGSSASFQLVASGGTQGNSLIYTLNSGSLPSGFTLSQSGLISGTSSVGGNYSFAVLATDQYGLSSLRSFSVLILPQRFTTQSISNTSLSVYRGIGYNKADSLLYVSTTQGSPMSVTKYSINESSNSLSSTETISVSAAEVNPRELAFNDDGTKAYTVGWNYGNIGVYNGPSFNWSATSSLITIPNFASYNGGWNVEVAQNRYLITGPRNVNGIVYVYDTQTNSLLFNEATLPGFTAGPADALAWDPVRNELYAATYGGATIYVYSFSSINGFTYQTNFSVSPAITNGVHALGIGGSQSQYLYISDGTNLFYRKR